jgi:hypothetical protein
MYYDYNFDFLYGNNNLLQNFNNDFVKYNYIKNKYRRYFIYKNKKINQLLDNNEYIFDNNKHLFLKLEDVINNTLSIFDIINLNNQLLDRFNINIIYNKKKIIDIFEKTKYFTYNNKNRYDKIINFKTKLLNLLDIEYYKLIKKYKLKLENINIFTHPFMDLDIKPFNVLD